MPTTIPIESTSVEPVAVTLKVSPDPTAETIEFLVTAYTASDPSGTWVAGEWTSSWVNGIITAETPEIGPGADLDHDASGRSRLWYRIAGKKVGVAAILLSI